MADVVKTPLLDCVFAALDVESSFDSAVECICTIFKETSEVDEYMDSIQILLPKLLALKPRIAKYAAEEDEEAFKGITRLFAEAGESWVVLIAREPKHFGDLVEAILECAHRDWEKDAIGHTFRFWYELKQYLVMEKYIQARVQCVDIYSKLVDILMKQLEFPTPDDPQSLDLFDGDREAEEKFREFRHVMGDCLKDCCEVMGVTQCLTKVLAALQAWMASYGATATETSVPHWQELEAPLFAMRAMGRMVDKDEDIILPQIMPILVQIPSHTKLRFAAIMALGRYTEWTSNHPEFLEPQFQYIAKSFETDSKEIVRAAAMAMKFFCADCKHHLGGQVGQLQSFYNTVLDSLPHLSKEELTEGVAQVVAVQKPDQIYGLLELYVDPLMERLKIAANNAKDEEGELEVAGEYFSKYMAKYVLTNYQIPCNCSLSSSSGSSRILSKASHIQQWHIGRRSSRFSPRSSEPSSSPRQFANVFVAAGETWSSPTAPPWSHSSPSLLRSSPRVLSDRSKAASSGSPLPFFASSRRTATTLRRRLRTPSTTSSSRKLVLLSA